MLIGKDGKFTFSFDWIYDYDSFLHSTGVNLTNINATGVITATKFVGEVSVGSSITFEDNEAYFEQTQIFQSIIMDLQIPNELELVD